MGKLKNPVIGAGALTLAILTCTGTDIGDFMRKAAFASAGIYENAENPDETHIPSSDSTSGSKSSGVSEENSEKSSENSAELPSSSVISSESSVIINEARGEVITLNRQSTTDDVDYSVYNSQDGAIYRYNFGKMTGDFYINLESGAQVWNNTEISNETLEKAASELPEFHKTAEENSPRVLVYHTHSNESFLPKSDFYDEEYPIRSADCSKNMIAVGDALCESLAKNGVTVIHECRQHDYPMFTGAYYRSAETVSALLEKYPDIDIVIDLHRDGIVQNDGSLSAPVCEVNGKTAAQFMIISCCENEYFDMPDYIENFKLACLLQNTAEEMYPNLARPVLFDYRNYNQSLSRGALLIEVGSHGNSLDEAVYTGELLGNVIAKALEKATPD